MRLRSIIIRLSALLLLTVFLSAGIIVVKEDNLKQEYSYPIDTIFPYPESLRPQVEFWIQIFSRYNSSQVLIHDAVELGRIYEVVDFVNLFPDKKVSNYVKWQATVKIKKLYQEELYFLHEHPRGYPEGNYSPFQKRLVRLFADDRGKDKYYYAAENVRIQFGLSDRFKRGIETLGKYRPFMAEIFNKHELPLELLAIPLYESSFVLRAMSFVSAAGVWQFMPYTARLYMRMNSLVDERYDPLIATEGAAKLLSYNYKHAKSWPLAITSYNHGLNGMLTAKRRLGTDDMGVIVKKYRSPSFGFASRNFYAEFLAAKYCLKNMYELYNNIEFSPAWEFDTLTLDRPRTLTWLSRQYGISIDDIYEYNPSFKRPLLRGSAALWKGYTLRLPPGTLQKTPGPE